MLAARWLQSGCVALALTALLVLTHCSSKPAADGASCSADSGCASNRCASGACEGSDCQCDGTDCRGQSTCLSGWLCTRGDATSTGDILPQCRQICTDGSCSSDKHCEDGVCHLGPEPFSLTWVSFPRTVPCAANQPCNYEVKPQAGINVVTYTWTFGDADPMDTTTPTNMFTYTEGGTYDVRVHAVSDTGAVADVAESETLCEGAKGADCDTAGAPCCEGTCTAMSLCQ